MSYSVSMKCDVVSWKFDSEQTTLPMDVIAYFAPLRWWFLLFCKFLARFKTLTSHVVVVKNDDVCANRAWHENRDCAVICPRYDLQIKC